MLNFDQEMQKKLLLYLAKNAEIIKRIEIIMSKLPDDFDPEGSQPIEIELSKIFEDLITDLRKKFPESDNAECTIAVAMFLREIGKRVNPKIYERE